MTRLPVLIPETERTPALITHLSPLAGLLLPSVGNVLGPLVAWLALRDRSRVLDEQGKEALNFQLSFWLYGLIVGALAFFLFSLGLFGSAVGAAARPELAGLAMLGTFGTFFLFYLPVMVVLGLIPFVFMIVAVVRVSAGQPYHYPLTLRFLR